MAVLALALGLAGACGGGGSGAGPGGGLTVFAASSLSGPFTNVGRSFEAAHPGAAVRFSFAASSTLVAQLRAGAPADVVVVADPVDLGRLGRLLATRPAVVARNRLAILVPPGNPWGVRSLADLGRPGLAVVLCAPEAPCGALAAQVLARAGTRVEPRSYELDAKAVVSRVALGEADAGIGYASDGHGPGAPVEAVPIPRGVHAGTTYRAAVVEGTGQGGLARAFVAFLTTEAGRRSLLAGGLEAP